MIYKTTFRHRYGIQLLLLLSMAFTLGQAAHASELDDLLNSYKQSATKPFSAKRGEAIWSTEHPASDGGAARSCSACHTTDLTVKGKHIRTGKIIQPMAPSVNPERLSKTRKMKKWLLRNCKWVMGRECSSQEKGDILTFIKEFK